MKKFLIPSMTVLTAFFIFFSGCTSKTEVVNPERPESFGPDFGYSDLQSIAAKMVNSMLSSPVIAQRAKPPIVIVYGLRNKSTEHIDTKSITDKIRTALIQSQKVKFLNRAIRDQMDEEREYQSSGNVSASTRKKLGQEIGADYLLTGEISSIVKQQGRKKLIYYKVTLNLTNLESGIIDWADEKEIAKKSKKKIFGF